MIQVHIHVFGCGFKSRHLHNGRIHSTVFLLVSDMKKTTYLKDRWFLKMPFDWNLILTTVFLNIFGIIMIYSASYYYAESAYGYPPYHFAMNQFKYALAGFALLFLLSYIRPAFWKKLGLPALFASLLLLILLLVPGFRVSSHGASRWIKLGPLRLQVAEPIKLGMIMFLSFGITHRRFRFDWKTTAGLLLIIGCTCLGVAFLSNNMSTAIIIFLMAYFTIMLLSPHMKKMMVIAIIFVLFLALSLFILNRTPYSPDENFRITRIRAWLNPTNELFSDNKALQATQARYAIASGGILGKGLGQSLIKFKLPEPHNDYILAIIFEELGVFGVSLLTYLFIYLLYRIFRIYRETEDKFSKAFVLGVFFHFALQILLNYAVTLGLLPTMGVTLPFISAGGSSVVFFMIELGFVLSVQRQNTEIRLYREADEEHKNVDPYYKRIREEQELNGDSNE